MVSFPRLSPAQQRFLLATVTICGVLVLALLADFRVDLAPLISLHTVTRIGGAVSETRYNPVAFVALGTLTVVTLGSIALFARFALPFVWQGSPGSSEAIASASKTLGRELASALTVIRGTLENNAAYERSLADAQSRLAKLDEAEQVRVVVSLLVAENQRMRLASVDDKKKLESCARKIDTLQASLRGAEEATLTDPLTGIGNRRLFNVAMEEAIEVSSVRRTPLSLIMCDIDHFKRVNDAFGHHVGDEIIKSLARVIETNVRETDSVVRYGGEEFAIILPGTGQKAAQETAERIRGKFGSKQYSVRKTNQQLGLITASFGVAEFRPGDDVQALIQRADAKLYEAKALGRNRVAGLTERR